MQAPSFFSLNRRLSSRAAALFSRTPLAPDHVTTLSLGAGLWAGYFFAQGTRGHLILGAVFVHLAFVLGRCRETEASAPGAVAARFGTWYASAADLAVYFAMWTGLALGAVALGVPGTAVRGWWLAAMAGSAILFARRTGERLAGTGKAAGGPGLSGPAEDPTLPVYAGAILGSPWLFLIAAALATHALWLRAWRASRRAAA